MDTNKKALQEIFFREIPKARKMSSMWKTNSEFLYDAHLRAQPGTKVLNVICTHDTSAKRGTVYKNHFFNNVQYLTVSYWADRFEVDAVEKDDASYEAGSEEMRYHIPYPSNHFDVIVTTKIILEHVSEPEQILREFKRVLKPGGEAFIIAPLVRRQHQAPHDYFRFTEYGLEYLFKKVGLEKVYIKHSNGYVETATQYGYFFQRGLNAPKWVTKIFDFIHRYIVEPIGFMLEKLDNGYGRDFTLYFYSRVKKSE